MCTVLLPPGVNPIAVNKYININTRPLQTMTPDSKKSNPIKKHDGYHMHQAL